MLWELILGGKGSHGEGMFCIFKFGKPLFFDSCQHPPFRSVDVGDFGNKTNDFETLLKDGMATKPTPPQTEKRKKTLENTLPKTHVAPENGGFQ